MYKLIPKETDQITDIVSMAFLKKISIWFKKAEEKVGIVLQFRLYTFIVMIIIGWLIINSLSAYIKEYAGDRLSDSAFIFGKSISHHIGKKDLSGPLTNKEQKELDKFVNEQLLAKTRRQSFDILLGLAIYYRDGSERYSSIRPSINPSGPHRKYVIRALKGKASNKLTKLTSSLEKKRLKSLIEKVGGDVPEIAEVHIPIYQGAGKPQAVAKMYLDATATNRFVVKSFGRIVLIAIMGLFFLYLSLSWFFYRANRRIAEKNQELNSLTDKVMRSLKELEDSYMGTMQALTMAVDAKDHYTAGHSFRVASFAKEIGRELGFTEEALANLEKGARFHDIGKIGIKENVLNKHGPLTPQEFREMQRHTIIGAKIIEPVKSFHSIIPIIRSHHERVDGKGYPDGLSNESIPIEARIIAVADCFDAMTTDRPNRRAYPANKAIEIINKESGKHFDKEVVQAFLKAYSGQQMWTKKTLTIKTHKKSA